MLVPGRWLVVAFDAGTEPMPAPEGAFLEKLRPLANIIMLFVLAFSEWPVERELKLLRGAQPPPAPR